ncbi:MAG: AtpZ/AtpI family protein [Myxococcota bacterium]
MSLLGPEGRKQLQAVGSVGTAGIELAVSIVIGFFGGKWLDDWLGTGPWLQWLGFGFGLVAGFRNLFRVARRVQQKLSEEEREDTDENR